jgi:hypothetical protein
MSQSSTMGSLLIIDGASERLPTAFARANYKLFSVHRSVRQPMALTALRPRTRVIHSMVKAVFDKGSCRESDVLLISCALENWRLYLFELLFSVSWMIQALPTRRTVVPIAFNLSSDAYSV